jgi:hypothetical protein
VRLTNQAGAGLATSQSVAVSSNWTDISVRYTAPAGFSSQLRVVLSSTKAGAAVGWDNVRVTATYSRLDNPNFETSLAGWQQVVIGGGAEAAGLVVVAKSIRGVASIDRSNFLSGGFKSVFVQRFAVSAVAGVRYCVSAMAARLSSTPVVARLYITLAPRTSSLSVTPIALQQQTIGVSSIWRILSTCVFINTTYVGLPLFVNLESNQAGNTNPSAAVGWDIVETYTQDGQLTNANFESVATGDLPYGFVATTIRSGLDHPLLGMRDTGAAPQGVVVRAYEGVKWLSGGGKTVFSRMITERTVVGRAYTASAVAIRAGTQAGLVRFYFTSRSQNFQLGAPTLGSFDNVTLTTVGVWVTVQARYVATAATTLFINMESNGGSPSALVGWDSLKVQSYLRNPDFEEGRTGWRQALLDGATSDLTGAYNSGDSPAGVSIVTVDRGRFFLGGSSSVFSQRIALDVVVNINIVARVRAFKAGPATSTATASIYVSSQAQTAGRTIPTCGNRITTRVLTANSWDDLEVQCSTNATYTGSLFLNLEVRGGKTNYVAWDNVEITVVDV